MNIGVFKFVTSIIIEVNGSNVLYAMSINAQDNVSQKYAFRAVVPSKISIRKLKL